jgi:hypothetical protein
METTPNTTPEIVASPTSAETPTPIEPTPEPALTEAQKVRAAVNDPADKFTLGGRVFNIVDLPYDDYLRFIVLLEPLLKGIVGAATSSISIPGMEFSASTLSASSIASFCGESLPEMVRIICSQTEPDITAKEVKTLGKNPFQLAKVVMKQVAQNGLIKDFTDFFGQILPLIQTSQK